MHTYVCMCMQIYLRSAPYPVPDRRGTSVPLERRCVRFIDNFSAGTRGAASAECAPGLPARLQWQRRPALRCSSAVAAHASRASYGLCVRADISWPRALQLSTSIGRGACCPSRCRPLSLSRPLPQPACLQAARPLKPWYAASTFFSSQASVCLTQLGGWQRLLPKGGILRCLQLADGAVTARHGGRANAFSPVHFSRS